MMYTWCNHFSVAMTTREASVRDPSGSLGMFFCFHLSFMLGLSLAHRDCNPKYLPQGEGLNQIPM